MSVSTEVQRTLVKSPPELWAELSNPEALARHLGKFGEIRITDVEPETKVEWEADTASGVVHLKQSGWGTKVTLSVTHAAPENDEPSEPELVVEPHSEPAAALATEAEAEPVAAIEPNPEPVVVEPEVEATAEPETVVEPVADTAAELAAETQPEAEPQLRFFARLFRRRKTRPQKVETQWAPPASMEPAPEIEVVALAAPELTYPTRAVEPEPEPMAPNADLAAELASVEAQMEEETTELLTGVLDRLGAAHHRPFSRG